MSLFLIISNIFSHQIENQFIHIHVLIFIRANTQYDQYLRTSLMTQGKFLPRFYYRKAKNIRRGTHTCLRQNVSSRKALMSWHKYPKLEEMTYNTAMASRSFIFCRTWTWLSSDAGLPCIPWSRIHLSSGSVLSSQYVSPRSAKIKCLVHLSDT